VLWKKQIRVGMCVPSIAHDVAFVIWYSPLIIFV